MLAIGAAGLMNAVGNVAPRKVAELYELTAAGDLGKPGLDDLLSTGEKPKRSLDDVLAEKPKPKREWPEN